METDIVTGFPDYPSDFPAYPPADPAALAVMAGFGIVYLVFALAIYVYYAVCLMKIAKKTNIENGWWAWIPVLNILLMLKIAGKPYWWALLLLLAIIPIIGWIVVIAMMIMVWMKIAEAVHKPNWWGIMLIVPVVGLIVPGYLAFSKD